MEYNYSTIIKNVHHHWLLFFEKNKNELKSILNLLNEYVKNGYNIFPFPKDLLRTFNYIGPKDIKLVILGQDPYTDFEIHNNNIIPQACGMAFSVPKKYNKIPRSLINIFKEIKNCYPTSIIPLNGDLKNWVKHEKILLLNSSLSVIEKKTKSHQNLWNSFVIKIIKYLVDVNPDVIFLLMGKQATNKKSVITNHKIFITSHPSPQSAYNGFIGSKIFLRINNYLISKKIKPIKWLKIKKLKK